MDNFFPIRSHHAFIEDCLDAYIITASLDHFGISSLDTLPTTNVPPSDLSTQGPQEQSMRGRHVHVGRRTRGGYPGGGN